MNSEDLALLLGLIGGVGGGYFGGKRREAREDKRIEDQRLADYEFKKLMRDEDREYQKQLEEEEKQRAIEEDESKFTIGDIKHDLVIKIDVIDNGIGIPPDKLKEIFYPMVTTKNDGMGLGLSIAQSIVMQNHGIIECSSKNKETIFSVIIPWSQNA